LRNTPTATAFQQEKKKNRGFRVGLGCEGSIGNIISWRPDDGGNGKLATARSAHAVAAAASSTLRTTSFF
jgi:hypothetical protein